MSHHTRTPGEVFDHHARALNAANLDETAFDYAQEAFCLTPKS